MSSPVEKDLTVRVQLQKGLQKYLDRSDITEIAVNRPGFVWVEREFPAVSYSRRQEAR